MYDASAPAEDDIDKYSTFNKFADYEQYFLHSFENIPIKISNADDKMMITTKNQNEDNCYWNFESLRYSNNKPHFNSTFLRNSDEFSTEL